MRSSMLMATVAQRTPGLPRVLGWGARRLAGRQFVAAVAVVRRGPNVLVVGHRFRDGVWSLPGGWVRAREDPHRAVERELLEETGLEVRARAVVACERQAVNGRPLKYAALTLAFACDLLPVDGPAVVVSVELTGARWMSPAEFDSTLSPFERAAVDVALARYPT